MVKTMLLKRKKTQGKGNNCLEISVVFVYNIDNKI